MSLVEQAHLSTLPDFQKMDHETLRWIIINSPFHGVEFDVLSCNVDYATWFSALDISKEWFHEHEIIDGLHGSRHLLRVGFFCGLLMLRRKASLHDAKLASIAGLLHDIGRKNDKGDEGHAERSAEWLEAHARSVFTVFKVPLTALSLEGVASAVRLHEIAYSAFDRRQHIMYEHHRRIVDTLKTADALDRYRLPKTKWWPRDKYLVDVPSIEMKVFAFKLIVMSEKRYLQNMNNKDSVSESLKVLCG